MAPSLDPFKILGIGQDATSPLESQRSNPLPKAQNNSKTQPVAQKSTPDLWRVFFAHLPLQNETNVFILVNVLDIFTTYALLRHGGLEANPIANFFFRHWNVQGMVAFKMTVVAFVAILAQIIARRNLHRASQVLILGTIIVTLVVLYSLVLLIRRV